MKCKLLLTVLVASSLVSASAQKKQKPTTAYAITAAEKGHSNWGEVKLIDVSTGQEIKSIYSSKDEIEILNARTGKPVVKKDGEKLLAAKAVEATKALPVKKEIVIKNLDDGDVSIFKGVHSHRFVLQGRPLAYETATQTDKPFSTYSAACAYDKKNERLYYTPMGINELRYVDLKSKTPKIYYFEGEPFGALTSRRDMGNQVTRMVFGSDGFGYALTNNGEHLIRFTTKKKAEITDLGAITDDASNGQYSLRSGGHGGDMIADDKGKLYLITANKFVYKIDPATKIATYKGTIKGLPRGYSTNGAIVQQGTTVVVNSANSTLGYFKFDLNTMQAEKITTGEPVFNASDLANGTLVSEKKKKEEEKQPEVAATPNPETNAPATLKDRIQQNNIAVFPNPVAQGGLVKLSFANNPAGKYTIQLLDVAGKVIDSKQVSIGGKLQVEEFKIPALLGKGNYLIKVVGDVNKSVSINSIIVQ